MLNLDSLIPECYAQYRPLVADALRLFLAQLSPARRAALLRTQAAMPPGTPDEARAFAVMRACPTLHKLGQILARHRALDPAFRAELRRLESLPPSATLAAIRPVIERELGEGGMATVYLAEDLKHHRHVAIKVLDPELARALGSERFLREVEVTAKLTHPHILTLIDSGEADDFLYYVMPYIEGETALST